MHITTTYTIETFALFANTDSSIKYLNSEIKKFGFEFYSVNLKELESNFSNLFYHPKDYDSEIDVQIENADYTISKKFLDIVTNTEILGHNILFNKEVVLLKRIENFELKIEHSTINQNETIKVMGETQQFVKSLIQQLRLFKNGNIQCPVIFQIDKQSRGITGKFTGKFNNTYYFSEYSLSLEEAKEFSTFFKKEFEQNNLVEIAISNFNLSYEASDTKSKFLLLMTCLESLFNLGKDQIAHTISRHLSIIISKSKEEFDQNYNHIKKLYNIRNGIIHGGVQKSNLIKEVDDLANLVRKAIIYCIKLDIQKDELFKKLNSLGYSELE